MLARNIYLAALSKFILESNPELVWGQALSLTYGRFFAEFLNIKSLVPLGLLALYTSVGFRYGAAALKPLEVFLGTLFRRLSQVKT